MGMLNFQGGTQSGRLIANLSTADSPSLASSCFPCAEWLVFISESTKFPHLHYLLHSLPASKSMAFYRLPSSSSSCSRYENFIVCIFARRSRIYAFPGQMVASLTEQNTSPRRSKKDDADLGEEEVSFQKLDGTGERKFRHVCCCVSVRRRKRGKFISKSHSWM